MSMEEQFQTCQECFKGDDKRLALKYNNVIRLHSLGSSYNSISDSLSISKGSISKLVSKFHQYSDVIINLRQNNSRPVALDTKDQEYVKEFIESSENRLYEYLKSIKEALFLDSGKKVCTQTILFYLNTIGKYRIPQTIPCLSLKNQSKRLEFCQYQENDRFSYVFFTDESSFQLYQNTLKIFQFNDTKQIQKPKPNPNNSILIWACVFRKRKVAIQRVNGTINSEVYINILAEHFPHSGNKIYGENNRRYQQDNAPAHKSYLTTQWLTDTIPRLLRHPPQCPDLNHMELIWVIMKKEIEKQFPNSIEQLEQVIFQTWNNITLEQIKNIIDNLCDSKIPYVIQNEGRF